MQTFLDEIVQQPQALDHFLNFYASFDLAPAQALFQQKGVLLVGMGASYHAAQIVAYRKEVDPSIRVADAVDALYYTSGVLSESRLLVYVSQSGASGEIEPLFDRLPPGIATMGITNHPDSPLGRRADTVLPICAGEEFTVASKTFLNTLGLLNLLGGVELGMLRQVQDRVAGLLNAAEAIRTLWLETLANARSLYFLGHGPHAITARHCAMMVGEWAKRPVAHASIGAFRHGYIEAVQPGMGVVIFSPAGAGQSSAQALANELAAYGAAVLVVEDGYARRPNDPPLSDMALDEFLAPMLDVIPVQLFAEGLAQQEHIPPGFRYINKVVTKL